MEEDRLLLEYNLQLFGDDKTEDATSKKVSETRDKGQVGKSQEFAHAVELIAAFLMIRLMVSYLGSGFFDFFNWTYGRLIVELIKTERSGISANTVVSIMFETIKQMALLVLPFLLISFLVAALATGLQFTFKVTTEPLKPKLSKINPGSGIKRIFSKQSIVNLLLSIAKLSVISIIAYITLRDHINELFLLYDLDIRQAVSLVGDIIINCGIRISFAYLIIGIIDLIYQKRKFKKDIKMTKQEVKDEYKSSEGDPQIKGQIKQRMREASQRRMMQAVPQADVVITNPTQIAVALKYDAQIANAPLLTAKGEQYMAQRIKDAAKEAGIPIIENKPLARQLYSSVEVGEMIPAELYTAVAEILALIFMRREGHA